MKRGIFNAMLHQGSRWGMEAGLWWYSGDRIWYQQGNRWKRQSSVLWVMFMSVCRSCDLAMVLLKAQHCKLFVGSCCGSRAVVWLKENHDKSLDRRDHFYPLVMIWGTVPPRVVHGISHEILVGEVSRAWGVPQPFFWCPLFLVRSSHLGWFTNTSWKTFRSWWAVLRCLCLN